MRTRDELTVIDRDAEARMWNAALRGEAWALEELAYNEGDHATTPDELWEVAAVARAMGLDGMADRAEGQALSLVEAIPPPFVNRPPRTRAEVRAMWRWQRCPPEQRAEGRAAVARYRVRVRAAVDALVREAGGR